MKRVGVVALALSGVLAFACSSTGGGDTPDPGSTAGSGGFGAGGFGTGGFGTGGSGGGFGATGGVGGSTVGGVGGASGKGGAPVDPGVYTESAVVLEDAPPPIAGGTLLLTGTGHTAAVSDPDHDQVVIVDIDNLKVTQRVQLLKGDDPGRLVEDKAGHLHVALRAGRGVAVIDPGAGTLLGRLPACLLPRGLAYDANRDVVHVACAEGALVTYTASAGDLVRRLRLDRDLRDVVIDGERLLVSRFRAAEVLVVEADGQVSRRVRPATNGVTLPPTRSDGGVPVATTPPPIPGEEAAVAWRMIPGPSGGAVMVHQMASLGVVGTKTGGYGGGCRHIISTGVSLIAADGGALTMSNMPIVLPVDVAITTTRGGKVVVGSAGWTPTTTFSHLEPYTEVSGFPIMPAGTRSSNPLNFCTPARSFGINPALISSASPPGRVVAIAYGPVGDLLVQTREPATLTIGNTVVRLDERPRKDTGHELFHNGTAGGIACASCHPEGHEDGRTWNFDITGARRTQSLRGGIMGTAPFHWNGDMTDFDTLMGDVFRSRMTGPAINTQHVAALMQWIDRLPALQAPPADDAGAVERGKALFENATVGCATCHSGALFTNNLTMDVNTLGRFQVPSLVGVGWRAPYMHSGCASTLLDRFGACGGGDAHGNTSQLTVQQRSDLVAYLETL